MHKQSLQIGSSSQARVYKIFRSSNFLYGSKQYFYKPNFSLDPQMPCTSFISLGSNTGKSCQLIISALREIASFKSLDILACSPLFYTEPQEKGDQPWFYNMAAMLRTGPEWRPEELLQKLHDLEKSLGRERDGASRFGPRPIDLDLIIFGNETSLNPACLLPHPRAHRRAFVLVPLLCLAPGLTINSQSLADCLAALNWRMHGWQIWQCD